MTPRSQLRLGQHSPITTTAIAKNREGRWITVKRDRRVKADAWRARARYRGRSGKIGEVSRRGLTEREAHDAVVQALREILAADKGGVTASTPLTVACERWLDKGDRGSTRSARTMAEYRGAYERCVLGRKRGRDGEVLAEEDTLLKNLSLGEANDVQTLEDFLTEVALTRGMATAKHVRVVLSGTLADAVRVGVLPANAMRSVELDVKAPKRTTTRNTEHAFTVEDLAKVLTVADDWADRLTLGVHPGTARFRRSVADLVRVLAGTGMRIGEALRLRWEDVDLDSGVIVVRGTKSASALRTNTLPSWTLHHMRQRAHDLGAVGLVFPAPRLTDPERPWDASNANRAVTSYLEQAGFPWARSHTFRKSAVSISLAAGVPLQEISNQVGHANISQTLGYVGREGIAGPKAGVTAALDRVI